MNTTLLLATAKLAATRAANYAHSQSGRRHDANSISRFDIKHKLDVECEALATRTLLGAFPDSTIIGEESNTLSNDPPPPPKGIEWIVDPIDGTINFFHGMPYWNCSIAVRVDGVMKAGVVCAPELGLCFEATDDGPALCNGEPIHVSSETDLKRAIVHTGSDKEEAPEDAFRFFDQFARIVQRPRVYGSAALDICFVASGRCEGYFEHGIYIWDYAAADLILRRAGGKSEILRHHGGYRGAYFATSGQPSIHDALKAAILPLLRS